MGIPVGQWHAQLDILLTVQGTAKQGRLRKQLQSPGEPAEADSKTDQGIGHPYSIAPLY